jgi:hypothetical protein
LKTKTLITLVILLTALLSIKPALCWSNGGYSADPTQPDYGTHDWIAQHALDWLPSEEKKFITDNLLAYLYGTELPDNNQASDGIGDTTKHHIYFGAGGALQDAASAQRASEEYQKALNYLNNNDAYNAAKEAGIMTHYIVDMAVFGHVMGSSTPWGTETHHSDYEDYVNTRTGGYSSTFNSYLSYDGALATFSAYDAAVNIANDTTFGGSSHLTCVWMDDNYNWNDAAFSGRAGQSLNLAVNAVADVLHTLYQEAAPAPTASPSPTPTIPEFPAVVTLTMLLTLSAYAVALRKKRWTSASSMFDCRIENSLCNKHRKSNQCFRRKR